MLGGNLRSHSLASPRGRVGVGVGVLEPGPGSSSLGRQGGAPGPRLTHNPPTRGGSLWGHSTARGRASSSDLGGCSLWPEILQSRLCCILPCQLWWPVGTSGRRRQLQDPRTRCSWDARPLPHTVRERLCRATWLPRAAEPIGWGDKTPHPVPPFCRSSRSSQAFPPQPGRESCCNLQAVLSLASSGQMK